MTTPFQNPPLAHQDQTNKVVALILGANPLVMDYIFKNLLFTLPDLKKNSTITLKQQALTTLLGKLQGAGIIAKVVEKQGSKPAIWKFSELMDLIQG